MSSIILDNVSKRFGSEAAVDDVSLEIAAGEFVALLGPSGCGKTTLLRLIAGFETLTDGRIAFDEREVAGKGRHVSPEDRNVAIVFQSYALWPHMSVGENVGYPLRVRGAGRETKTAKVREALAAVDLSGFEDRRPADLSGGQRQRVALARCLAMDPAVVLLDEPLANLDVNLRASMEETFRDFHARTGATMVYVTHDQAEAMAMADRIAVMDKGRVLQVAEPMSLYAQPATETVARFVGHGQIVGGVIIEPDAEPGAARVAVLGSQILARSGAADMHSAEGKVRLCLRSEALFLTDEGGIAGTVRRATFKGSHVLLEVEPADAPDLVLTVQADRLLHPGSIVKVAVRDAWILPVDGIVRPEGAGQIAKAA